MQTTKAEKLDLAALQKKSRDARGWSLSALWTASGKTGDDCDAISAEGGLEAIVKSLVSKAFATFKSFGSGRSRWINPVVEQRHD